MLNILKPILKITLSSENENINEKDEEPKAIKAAEEIKKERRESEQLNVDPEQVLEEEEKRQPHSVEDQ
jgi:hypothetical protein